MKTELLIIFPDSESFCTDRDAFLKFLDVDAQIIIAEKNISFKKKGDDKDVITARFHLDTDRVKSKNERYFLLTLDCQHESRVDDFNELCERVKTVCERISPNSTAINTLWDDVGHIYAKKAYPFINEVENLMRRLIAKFMLITVGMSWSKDAIQPELLKKIENSDEGQPFLNELHKLDFIHLNQVLFEKKRDIPLDELDRVLLKTNFDDADKEKIRKYIPRSNWEKYFSALMEEKDVSLEAKWERLYKLRNKVAHNRHVTKADFEQIKGLSSAIKEMINRATAKLGEIDLTKEDRELIIQSYTSNSSIGIIVEQAVLTYYLTNEYLIHAPSGFAEKYGLDFIAEKNGKKIGVEVIAIHPKNFHSYITLIEARMRRKDKMNMFSGKSLSAIHLRFVMTTDYTDYQIERILQHAIKFSEMLGEGYELSFGRLNENNEYTNLV
jgi:hypothetical protein